MKTNLLVFVALFSLTSVAGEDDIFNQSEGKTAVAAPTLDVANLVDALENEWRPLGFVTRLKNRTDGTLIGEVMVTVPMVNRTLEKEMLPPNKILPELNDIPEGTTEDEKVTGFKVTVTDSSVTGTVDAGTPKGKAASAKAPAKLRLLTCLKASPYGANETRPNSDTGTGGEVHDPKKPASCLVKVKFSTKASKFVMDVTMASLQDAGGAAFLSEHYKMDEDDAKRFSTTAPLFLNTKNLREGLLDPFIKKVDGQFVDRRKLSPGTSTKITPGKVGFALVWVIGMILLGVSLTWVTKKARNSLTGSAELGKFEVFLIILALIILGGLMIWLGWWGVLPIGIGLGGFLTILQIILRGGEIRRAEEAQEEAPQE